MKLGRFVPWLGVVASALLLINVNVLGARWYERWDFTSDKLYTLSQPTRELLAGLREPVEVDVLLSKSDPLSVSVRHMLEAYGAETRQLRVRYVDPDRSPAEFLAVQQKYQILAGKAEDGRIVTDAVIVLAQGDKHWFLTSDELVQLDEDSGRSRPSLELALSTALDNLRRAEKAKLCFTTGHREPTLDDAGPQGLSELRKRLEKSNFEPVSVDASAPQVSYADCIAVVVATPEREFGAEEASKLSEYVKNGGSALLLLSPIVGEGGKVRGTGLDPVLELAGVKLSRDVVLERDKAQRLPSGSGELFFAKLRPHPITRGVLHEDDKLSSRVLVAQARSLDASGGASLLMESSSDAIALEDLSPLGDGPARSDLEQGLLPKTYGVAAARELPKLADEDQRAAPGRLRAQTGSHRPRLVVSGASNLAWNRNFQDPALYGNQRLIENAISWLSARPTMLNVPQKAEREVGVSLSEESLDEVQRYVLLYMPAAAGLLGAFVLLRRRNDERRSRAESKD
ncbi:MAG TPA: GldG family protein [Polyangiaceae bacterium]|nr:GldG family protein [Polyangiaceae bacterium]